MEENPALIGKIPLNQNIRLVRRNNLVGEFVLVDAIGRSGKGMMAHVLASMSRVEKQSNDEPFDWVPRLYMLGKISRDAAVTVMRSEADTRLYNNMISRSVNFKFTDDTGTYRNLATMKYLRRLFAKEGQPVVDRVKQERPIFQNCTHDGLRMAKLFFEAFGDRLRIVYIVRDPVGIIYEWDRSRFGERIGKDPREFQLTYEWGESAVPLYAHGWEDEYLSSNSTDKVIGMIDWHFNGNMAGYASLSEEQRQQVMFVIFEEFVTNPIPYCEKIASFLGTETTSRTRKVLKREKCPRILDPTDREEKRRNIEEKASVKAVNKFHKLLEAYERREWTTL